MYLTKFTMDCPSLSFDDLLIA